MSRRTQVILAGAICVLGSVGAAWLATHRLAAGNGHVAQGLRELTDMTGRPVRLPAEPMRVLSLCTSASDTMAAMHQSRRLAAIDEYSSVVAGLDKTTVIGKGSAISKEQVLALQIDLAFVWWFQDDAAAMLEGLGVPVVRIRSGRAREVPAMIRLVGDCLNRRQAADKLALPVEQFLEQEASRPARPGARPVVYLELYGPFKTVGGDSYLGDLIELAGGRNIAADATGSVLLSAERLIQNEPDVVLFVQGFGDARAIVSRPGLAGLKAVRAGRVHPVDRRWTIAGPGLPQAVAYLRSILLPSASTERH